MAAEDFDDLLISMKTGFWNLLHFSILGVYVFVIPCYALSGAFMAPNVGHSCISQPTNVTLSADSNECTYSYIQTSQNGSNHEGKMMKEKCSRWEFNTTDIDSTITSEFDLVCDQAYLRPTYQTAYMVGSFIGSPLNGVLADRFGRRTMIYLGILLFLGMTVLSTEISNFYVIIIARALIGFSHPSIIQSGYILCMEVCEPKRRSTVGMVIAVPWAVGTMWFGFLGYMIRDWRWLQRACIIPAVLFSPMLRYLDESPRWLIVKGRHSEALRVIKTGYRRNKVSPPSDQDLMGQIEHIHQYQISLNHVEDKNVPQQSKTKNLLNKVFILFRTPEIRKITLLIYCIFLVSSTVFYGLSLNAVNFNLDPYVYMIIGGLMEAVAYVAPVPIIKKFGRIRPTVVFYIICGVSILALTFIPSELGWLVTIFAQLGRMCISAAYQVAFLIATEVFPTEVRLQGMGTANFISRIGSIASPYVTDAVGPILVWFPSVLFGCLSLIAGVATYFIPETLNVHMSDTVKQLEEEKKKQKRKGCPKLDTEDKLLESISTKRENA